MGEFFNFPGNHWDDYQGPDEDQNGIGDLLFPYPIDLQADLFPLMLPFENYLTIQGKIYLPLVMRKALTRGCIKETTSRSSLFQGDLNFDWNQICQQYLTASNMSECSASLSCVRV